MMKTNIKMQKIVVALLAVVTLALLGVSGEAKIDATPQQKQQLKVFAIESRNATRQKRSALRRVRMELSNIYGDYNLDSHGAKAAIQRISRLQLELLNQHLDNQIKIRSILNEDQFNQFVKMTKNRMHQRPANALKMHEESPMDMTPSIQMIIDAGAGQNQIKQLKKLIGPEQKKTITMNKIRCDSAQLLDIYSTYKLDITDAKKLINSIHNRQITLIWSNFRRQQALRSVLTQDQFNALHEKLVDRMRDMQNRRRSK